MCHVRGQKVAIGQVAWLCLLCLLGLHTVPYSR